MQRMRARRWVGDSSARGRGGGRRRARHRGGQDAERRGRGAGRAADVLGAGWERSLRSSRSTEDLRVVAAPHALRGLRRHCPHDLLFRTEFTELQRGFPAPQRSCSKSQSVDYALASQFQSLPILSHLGGSPSPTIILPFSILFEISKDVFHIN